MAVQTCIFAQHATLTTTTADTIVFSGQGSSLCVTNRDSSTTLYFNIQPNDEVQTLTLTAGIATETFKLTWNGNEAATAVTIPVGGFANVTAAQVLATMNSITGITAGDVTVTKNSNDYVITFTGSNLGNRDVGAITVTSKVGAADGSVAETTKGGCVSAADDTRSVLPLQAKVLPLASISGLKVAVVGNANPYSVEVF